MQPIPNLNIMVELPPINIMGVEATNKGKGRNKKTQALN
jgi:hypothetical protein